MDFKTLEAEILKDLQNAPAILGKVKDAITKFRGSALEPIVDKLWPGITQVEDTVLKDMDFFLSLDAQVVAWLNLLFPRA